MDERAPAATGAPDGPVTSVGVVGLGRMGLPIATRLRSAGLRVVGHDTAEPSRAAATSAGIALATDAAELAARTDCSLVVVGFDDEVRTVVADPASGLLAGAAVGHVVMVGATVAPALTPELSALAQPRGVGVIDACLCRGEAPAATGELLVLTGGDEATCARVEPVLRTIASDVHHLGGIGAGQVGKMINNYLLWLCVVGDYEAVRLGARMGVDPDRLRPALLASSGANWALETWPRPRPMPWAEADMEIVLASAQAHRLPVPAARVVRDEITRIKQEKAALPGAGVRSSMADFLRRLEQEGSGP